MKEVRLWVPREDVEALKVAARTPAALARLARKVEAEAREEVLQRRAEHGKGSDEITGSPDPSVRSRRHLPPRRPSETRKLVRGGQTIFLTVGYDPASWAPKEVFYSAGYRSGSDMEALVSDLCIAISVMLQHEGVTAASLKKSMGETFDLLTGDPMPASILGLLLEELARPPEWADPAPDPGEGSLPADEVGISGSAEVDPRAAGEAGRQDVPGPEGAARRDSRDRAPDASASGEATA